MTAARRKNRHDRKPTIKMQQQKTEKVKKMHNEVLNSLNYYSLCDLI